MTEFKECEDCFGYCCAAFSFTPLTKEDIARLADFFDLSVETFRERFVKPDTAYDTAYLRQLDKAHGEDRPFELKFGGKPCIFWTMGQCGVHEVKPSACANYCPSEHYDNDEKLSCPAYHKRLAMI